MITAVDTNILLDIILPDERYASSSEQLLTDALQAGALVISEPVYAELAAHFDYPEEIERFIADLGVRLEPANEKALFLAGRAWSQYRGRRSLSLTCSQCGSALNVRCQQCGSVVQSRQHIIADFIIAAHALSRADRLATRDRGNFKTYFPDLVLLDAT